MWRPSTARRKPESDLIGALAKKAPENSLSTIAPAVRRIATDWGSSFRPTRIPRPSAPWGMALWREASAADREEGVRLLGRKLLDDGLPGPHRLFQRLLIAVVIVPPDVRN